MSGIASAAYVKARTIERNLNNDLIVLGDSYANLNRRYQYTSDNTDTLGASGAVRWINGLDYGMPAGVANVEYRASDKSIRVKFNGSTFGAWTPLVAGMNVLTDGAGWRFVVGVKTRLLSGSDITETITVINNIIEAWGAEGDFAVLNTMAGAFFNPVAVHGIGGDDDVDLLARISQAMAAKPDGTAYTRPPSWVYLTSFGANQVVPGANWDGTTAVLQACLDKLKTYGVGVILHTLAGRYRDTIGTVMTSGEQTRQQTINTFLRAYAAKNPSWVYLIDSAALTYFQAGKTLAGGNGVTIDGTHLAQKGCWLRATAAMASRLGKVVNDGVGGSMRELLMSASNLHSSSNFPGTSGTGGTGVTLGTAIPNNLVVQRLGSGTDITCTASIVTDVLDQMDGTWLRLQISNPGATTQSIGVTRTASLASWGVAVGDEVFGAADINVQAASGVDMISLVVNFQTGSTALRTNMSSNRASTLYHKPVSGVHITPSSKVPTGTDTIVVHSPRVYVTAGGSADVYIRLPGLMRGSNG